MMLHVLLQVEKPKVVKEAEDGNYGTEQERFSIVKAYSVRAHLLVLVCMPVTQGLCPLGQSVAVQPVAEGLHAALQCKFTAEHVDLLVGCLVASVFVHFCCQQLCL